MSRGADRKANTLGGAAHLRLVICVSLRMAASAEAPSSPMRLSQRLRGMGGGTVRGHRCVAAGAYTEGWGYGLGLGLGLMAYSRLRTDIAAGSMKASSVAPVSPMPDARTRTNLTIASSSRSRSTGTRAPSQTPRRPQPRAAARLAADPRPGCSCSPPPYDRKPCAPSRFAISSNLA